MNELLYKQEVFQLVGLCMEIHRELGKGYDEVIYKDAFVVELSRAGIPFSREKNYEITYKGVILPHYQFQGRTGPADILPQLRENSCNSCPVRPQNS